MKADYSDEIDRNLRRLRDSLSEDDLASAEKALSGINENPIYRESVGYLTALASYKLLRGERSDLKKKLERPASGLSEVERLHLLAFLEYEKGGTDKAVSLWKQAEEYAERLGDRRKQALILNNLLTAGMRSGFTESLTDRFLKLLRINQEIGKSGDLWLTDETLARFYFLQGSLEKSSQMLKSCRSQAENLSAWDHADRLSLYSALLNILIGKPATSSETIERHLQEAREEQSPLKLFRALTALSIYRLWLGDAENARKLTDEAHLHLQTVNTPGREFRLALLKFVIAILSDSNEGETVDETRYFLDYAVSRLNQDAYRNLYFKIITAACGNGYGIDKKVSSSETNPAVYRLFLNWKPFIDFLSLMEAYQTDKTYDKNERRRYLKKIEKIQTQMQHFESPEFFAFIHDMKSKIFSDLDRGLDANRERQKAIEIFERIGNELPQKERNIFFDSRRISHISSGDERAESADSSSENSFSSYGYEERVAAGSSRKNIEKISESAEFKDRGHDPDWLFLAKSIGRLTAARTEEQLFNEVCDLVISLSKAERCFAFLMTSGGLPRRIGFKRKPGMNDPLSERYFSRSVVDEVFKSGEPIVSTDLVSEDQFRITESIQEMRLRSIFCMPVILAHEKDATGMERTGETAAIIYADSRYAEQGWTSAEMEFLQAIADHCAVILMNLRFQEKIQEETRVIKRQTDKAWDEMVGETSRMKEIFHIMERIIDIDIPVLIEGETGTGKDLTAEVIHKYSSRNQKEFVYLNCSAIPASLIESELFGIEKGVATGVAERKGLIETADGGTLYLDEVIEIPSSVQAKLLRFLQEFDFTRVGGKKSISVDVRVVSSSSYPLEKAVAEKRIREDLYYRLNGVKIVLPPLRERREDILPLTRFFMDRYNREFKKQVTRLSRESIKKLFSYEWPGNVRELESVVRKGILLAETDEPMLSIPERESAAGAEGETLQSVVDDFEKSTAAEALKRSHGHVAKAAASLNVSRMAMHRLIKKHGLSPIDFKRRNHGET